MLPINQLLLKKSNQHTAALDITKFILTSQWFILGRHPFAFTYIATRSFLTMSDELTPQLFGLKQSNRDFSQKNAWGKNQFNSSFPAALCCYLHSKSIKANYLSVNQGYLQCTDINFAEAWDIDPLGAETFFAFEAAHSPYQRYIIGSLPRTDLVIQNILSGQCVTALEVKLTALPDNTTYNLQEEGFGCEIVVRPDTIVYLACSIAQCLGEDLKTLLGEPPAISDWTNPQQVLPWTPQIVQTLKKVAIYLESCQRSFLLQPIWKTMGKSPQLADDCLDVFYWSNAGFLYFITAIIEQNNEMVKITRQTRSALWLYKMLIDIAIDGRFDHHRIIDEMSFNTKNDKAFAVSGAITNRFMSCPRLIKPIVKKDEIQNIILNGGQNLLSPERRFDAIVFNSPELFQS